MKTTYWNPDDHMLEFQENSAIVDEFECELNDLHNHRVLREEWVMNQLTDDELQSRISKITDR